MGAPGHARRLRSPLVPGLALALALALACAALALWTHRRALGGFFSLDDLVLLGEMRGVRPHAVTLWRFLSGEAYFRAAVALFGANPFPYHLVNWLLHGANVALLVVLVRRLGGGNPAALLAGGLFGATRLTMTAVHAPASVGELSALGLTLGMLLVRGDDRRAAALRSGLFGAALLCKETVILMPLLLLLPVAADDRPAARLRRAAPPLLLGPLLLLVLALAGPGTTRLAGEAYAAAWGPNLLGNLLTYAAWLADLWSPIPDLAPGLGPVALASGGAALLALAGAATLAWRATRLPAYGALWWLLALVPVLPLLHRTYLHYLYLALAGAGVALGGWLEWAAAGGRAAAAAGGLPAAGAAAGDGPKAAVARRPGRPARVAGILAAGIVLAHAAVADRLLARRAELVMPGTGVPLDPYLRKSEMARRASQAVAATLAGRPGRVAFLLPAATERSYSVATGRATGTPPPGTRRYGFIEAVLDEGRALRALHPNVDTVAFLHDWEPGFGEYELFGENRRGQVFSFGRGPDGFAVAGAVLLDVGRLAPARALLAGALTEFPDHAPLRYQHARALHLAGDSLASRRELEELVRRASTHPLAALIRRWLEGREAPR